MMKFEILVCVLVCMLSNVQLHAEAAGGDAAIVDKPQEKLAAPKVSGLKTGEIITVLFESSGCFHNTVTMFEFSMQTVCVSECTYVDAKPIKTKKVFGPLTLTDTDVAKLDLLFEFYAAEPRGGCTTVDKITYTKKKGAVVQSTRLFVDASCSLYEQRDTYLTFAMLAQRCEEARSAKKLD